MNFRLIEADCIEAMASMDAASVDAIVTDPPYGLEFMGKEWDRFRVDDPGTARFRGDRAGSYGDAELGDGSHPAGGVALGGGKRPMTFRCTGCGKRDQFRNPHTCPDGTRWARELIDPHAAPPTMLAFAEWCRTWALQAKRVLKPGGHLLAFGGTRTYHRLTCALEDAGFEIRDCLAWLYGSGFPKSLDVSKAIDKANGAEREVVGERMRPDGRSILQARPQFTGEHEGWDRPWKHDPDSVDRQTKATAPATPDAQRWQGWGTALKPAFEPIVLARKPLVGTVAANVLEHGTGALNIDGTRIATEDETARGKYPNRSEIIPMQRGVPTGGDGSPFGRWPPNVLLDEEAAGMLDEQSGEAGGGFGRRGSTANVGDAQGMFGIRATGELVGFGDSGGASRFFYIAKADREERNRGLYGFDITPTHRYGAGIGEGIDPKAPALDRNHHPTVKPVELMQWLCRLITPPGGTVLDPFTGSGSTGMAALREGFDFIGIEREHDYVEIARARIIGDGPLFNVEVEV